MEHNSNSGRRKRTRRSFSDEFRRDAVELVVKTGRPIAHVADELGIHDSTLGNWVRKSREQDRDGLDGDERARLEELEAEHARLRMERDLLKRTVAFWVSESTPRPAIGVWLPRRPRGSR